MGYLPTSGARASEDLGNTQTVLPQILSSSAIGGFRWVICTLLLLGVTKNYMDRQVLGVL
jgi:hypothetical protein